MGEVDSLREDHELLSAFFEPQGQRSNPHLVRAFRKDYLGFGNHLMIFACGNGCSFSLEVCVVRTILAAIGFLTILLAGCAPGRTIQQNS